MSGCLGERCAAAQGNQKRVGDLPRSDGEKLDNRDASKLAGQKANPGDTTRQRGWFVGRKKEEYDDGQ